MELGQLCTRLAEKVRIALPALDKGLIGLARLGGCALGLVDGGQGVVGTREGRIGGNSCQISATSPVQLSLLQEEAAEVVGGIGQGRIGADGGFQCPLGFRGLTEG